MFLSYSFQRTCQFLKMLRRTHSNYTSLSTSSTSFHTICGLRTSSIHSYHTHILFHAIHPSLLLSPISSNLYVHTHYYFSNNSFMPHHMPARLTVYSSSFLSVVQLSSLPNPFICSLSSVLIISIFVTSHIHLNIRT